MKSTETMQSCLECLLSTIYHIIKRGKKHSRRDSHESNISKSEQSFFWGGVVEKEGKEEVRKN